MTLEHISRLYEARLTRGGPLMGMPRTWTLGGTLSNSLTATTRWTVAATSSENELGGRTAQINATVSVRPAPSWQVSVQPTYDRTTDAQQYVTTRSQGRLETYGDRYIFAYIDRRTASMQFRLGVTFKPDLNLDVYAEPFAASGRYYDYGELLAPKSLERLTYGSAGTAMTVTEDGSRVVTAQGSTFTLANHDFNVRSFRSNVVLRWEWRPGSTMYAVWQQDRYGSESPGRPVGFGDAFRSLVAPGSNTFLIKTSFWIPVK